MANELRGPFVAAERIPMFLPALKATSVPTFWKQAFTVVSNAKSGALHNTKAKFHPMLVSVPAKPDFFSERIEATKERVTVETAKVEKFYDIPPLLAPLACLSHLQESVAKFERHIDITLWNCLVLEGDIGKQMPGASRVELIDSATQALENRGLIARIIWSQSGEGIRKSLKWMELTSLGHEWSNAVIATSVPEENGVVMVGKRDMTVKLPGEDPKHTHMHLYIAQQIGFIINLEAFALRFQTAKESV